MVDKIQKLNVRFPAELYKRMQELLDKRKQSGEPKLSMNDWVLGCVGREIVDVDNGSMIRVSPRDFEAIQKATENPPRPNEALRKLMRSSGKDEKPQGKAMTTSERLAQLRQNR